jgi:hypothetical protein
MHDAGYLPCMKFVPHDVEEQVFYLCHHGENLAIAFGLINTAPGTPLRIRKNLQVSEDCHTSTKFISKIDGRAIMVRDANHFNYFEDGVCFLAWTTGDASNLSCQSSYQVQFVYSSMSSGIVTQSKLNSVIRCCITEKVAMERPPWSFWFHASAICST